jgi:membrane-associated protease RseP (regulator of RpoE activity)
MKRLFIATLLFVLLGAASIAAGEDRGYIGVTVMGVDNQGEAAKHNGVFINAVHAGSGAEAAGLQVDDRIVALDGVAVETVADMDIVLDASTPGQTVRVSVLRDGAEHAYDVVLGGKPVMSSTISIHDHGSHPKWVIEMVGVTPRMGIKIQPLTAQLADHFGVPSGLLVTEVVEDGAAWKAGLQAGDVLLDVDGDDVASEHEVREVLGRRQAGDVVDVTVQRRGQLDRFAVTLEEGVKLSAGEMTFNVALDSGAKALDYRDVMVEVGESGDGEWTNGQPVTIRLTTGDDAEAIRARIHRLQEEIERLQEQLREHEDD